MMSAMRFSQRAERAKPTSLSCLLHREGNGICEDKPESVFSGRSDWRKSRGSSTDSDGSHTGSAREAREERRAQGSPRHRTHSRSDHAKERDRDAQSDAGGGADAEDRNTNTEGVRMCATTSTALPPRAAPSPPRARHAFCSVAARSDRSADERGSMHALITSLMVSSAIQRISSRAPQTQPNLAHCWPQMRWRQGGP